MNNEAADRLRFYHLLTHPPSGVHVVTVKILVTGANDQADADGTVRSALGPALYPETISGSALAGGIDLDGRLGDLLKPDDRNR